jgi:hypothetical protein
MFGDARAPRRELCGWLAVGSSVSCFREIINQPLHLHDGFHWATSPKVTVTAHLASKLCLCPSESGDGTM